MKLTKEQIRDIEEDPDYEDLEWVIKEEEDFNQFLKSQGVKFQ